MTGILRPPENAQDATGTGVDHPAVGALTHSAPTLAIGPDLGVDPTTAPGHHPGTR